MFQKVRVVNGVLKAAERDVKQFQERHGIHCLHDCFTCCLKADIFCTELEFYPLAYHLYKAQQAEGMLERLTKYENKGQCILFNPELNAMHSGCSYYPFRGLICRLFGFSWKEEKTGAHTLITCKPIKEDFQQEIKVLQEKKFTPIEMKNYYTRLYKVDLHLANRFIPINQAIQKAIERMLFFYDIRKKRDRA